MTYVHDIPPIAALLARAAPGAHPLITRLYNLLLTDKSIGKTRGETSNILNLRRHHGAPKRENRRSEDLSRRRIGARRHRVDLPTRDRPDHRLESGGRSAQESAPAAEPLPKGPPIARARRRNSRRFAAGAPQTVTPLASYEEWSARVRDPLVWLGEPDPVDSQEKSRADDQDRNDIRALFALWPSYMLIGAPYTTARIDRHRRGGRDVRICSRRPQDAPPPRRGGAPEAGHDLA